MTSIVLPKNRIRIYYFDANRHVEELAWASGWHATNITAESGGVAVIPGSAITSIALNLTQLRLYDFDANGHVEEQAWASGWHSTDIVAESGGLAAW